MKMDTHAADVVVIGGGIAGLRAARLILQHRCDAGVLPVGL